MIFLTVFVLKLIRDWKYSSAGYFKSTESPLRYSEVNWGKENTSTEWEFHHHFSVRTSTDVPHVILPIDSVSPLKRSLDSDLYLKIAHHSDFLDFCSGTEILSFFSTFPSNMSILKNKQYWKKKKASKESESIMGKGNKSLLYLN